MIPGVPWWAIALLFCICLSGAFYFGGSNWRSHVADFLVGVAATAVGIWLGLWQFHVEQRAERQLAVIQRLTGTMAIIATQLQTIPEIEDSCGLYNSGTTAAEECDEQIRNAALSEPPIDEFLLRDDGVAALLPDTLLAALFARRPRLLITYQEAIAPFPPLTTPTPTPSPTPTRRPQSGKSPQAIPTPVAPAVGPPQLPLENANRAAVEKRIRLLRDFETALRNAYQAVCVAKQYLEGLIRPENLAAALGSPTCAAARAKQ